MRLGKVLVIDGSYLLHRALHIDHLFNLRTKDGVGTGGIFQFVRSLNSEVRKYNDYYPIVCWDAGLAERRVNIYPNYKHNQDRKAEAEEMKMLGIEPEVDEYLVQYRNQRQLLMEFLSRLGVPSLRFQGWEGDDLLYIVSRLSNDAIVLTDDKDLIQLLSPTVRISRPLADQLLVYEKYQEEHNDPDMMKFIIRKSIVGDGSDNIPKCADRVGGKTAEYIAEVMIEHRNDWKDILEESNKKALHNFIAEDSLKQFYINMELIDLSRVEVTSDILRDISVTIRNGLHVPDFFKSISFLGKLEISEVNTNELISRLTSIFSKGDVYYDETA